MPDQSISERMADAARDLQRQQSPRATMDAAARIAVENVPGADAAAISIVRRRKHVETLSATHEYAVGADLLQYELEEGPCLDAIWEERVVHSPDLDRDPRWTRWAPRVVEELGIRSMLCFQLFTHGDTVGGLNLYSHRVGAYDVDARDDGLALAAHIAVAVAGAQRIEQLTEAVASRTAIGVAVGMLVERFDLSPDRAFEVLARISSESNTKLKDLADDLVRDRDLPQLRAGGADAAT